MEQTRLNGGRRRGIDEAEEPSGLNRHIDLRPPDRRGKRAFEFWLKVFPGVDEVRGFVRSKCADDTAVNIHPPTVA